MSRKGAELQLDPWIKALIYGRSGRGKTCTCGFCLCTEEMRPMYVFDFDFRIYSLLSVVGPEELEHLEYDHFIDPEGEKPSAFDRAEGKLRELSKTIKLGEGPRTLVVDSLTFMQKAAMARIQHNNRRPANSIPQQQDYLAQMALVESFVSRMRGLPCHVICIASEDAETDTTTELVTRGIDVTGKLARRLPGYFNEQWYMDVKTVPGKQPIHRCMTAATTRYDAKTCFAHVLEVAEDPKGIWQKIIDAQGARREDLLK